MGLAPMGMYHELDVDAVAAHDIEACWLADNETFGRTVTQQPAFRDHLADALFGHFFIGREHDFWAQPGIHSPSCRKKGSDGPFHVGRTKPGQPVLRDRGSKWVRVPAGSRDRIEMPGKGEG